MAVLSAETNMAGVSELSPAIFLSSATLTGLYPNEIENRLLYKKMDKKVKMDWRRWASIARLSIRKICCLNGSRKLLTQKIMWVDTETRLWTRLFSARSAIFCRY